MIGTSTPVLTAGEPYSFDVFVTNTDTLQYFLSYETGGLLYSDEVSAASSNTFSIPAGFTQGIPDCQLALRVVALSDTVVIPDVHKSAVEVAHCGASLEERLEALDITMDVEFLRTAATVIGAATEGGASLEEVIRILDEQEASGATVALLYMILDGSVDGDELFEYLRP